MQNGLDAVMLSPDSVQRWIATARVAVMQRQLDPSAIPDEDCEPLENGKLRIFCQLATGEIIAEMAVPAGEWAWSKTGVQ
jgi:hypothetical protein